VSVISHPEDVSGPPGFWTLFGRFLGIDPSASAPRHSIVLPSDVEVAADGTVLYVSDFALGIIHVFDFGNKSVRYIGEAEGLARPAGLALDSQGNLWIVEQQTRQIRVVNPAGKTIQIHRSEKLVRPVDIELDESRGVFYVADPAYQRSKDHFVHRFSMDGEHRGVLGTGRGMEEGQLLFPTYLAVDEQGSVFVSDTMNARISKFDADGQFDRVIGSRGDGFGLFDKPKGLALDSYGNLYVADSSWSNVQVFGPQGDVLIYFGSRGGYPGLLRNPTGIAIDRSTNTIYVADYLNHRMGIYRLVNTDPGDGIPTSDEDEIGEKN
jgi:DNA-binding beta-propeller fold protein YncE